MATRSPPTDPDPLAGTPYRTARRLGSGGFGEVVEAEHMALEKRVVVKLLHAELAGRRDRVDRMRLEAQVLARLAHPGIVAVTDFGETPSGRPYLVMERLQGRTLGDELRARGALPLVEALGLARQALAGLSAAHEAGIIHRDVKPDNLFLCAAEPAEGRPARLKLLDFGLAKILPREGSGAPAPLRFPTEDGVVVGTPRYFAPEQVEGLPLDARTDVYAVGAVLYALVSGRGPFDHLEGLDEVLEAHRTAVPAKVSEHSRAAVPRELDAALARALAKSPARRFPSASAFSAELGRIEDALTAPAAPPRLPVGRRAVAAPPPDRLRARAAWRPSPVVLLGLIAVASGAASALAAALLWP